ncbi:leucine-rich repeat domain-containing protein [Corynebacterium pygosceleis]|uniref:leucine-rich repeat domain-containing protein n=1 Tax=Corynebacterium pygosceleis TaxID=2800406 RepID=UPI001A1E1D1D|nr:leucine-rich repeat domain-containing protein [Corynebacterium pygosceleis]
MFQNRPGRTLLAAIVSASLLVTFAQPAGAIPTVDDPTPHISVTQNIETVRGEGPAPEMKAVPVADVPLPPALAGLPLPPGFSPQQFAILGGALAILAALGTVLFGLFSGGGSSGKTKNDPTETSSPPETSTTPTTTTTEPTSTTSPDETETSTSETSTTTEPTSDPSPEPTTPAPEPGNLPTQTEEVQPSPDEAIEQVEVNPMARGADEAEAMAILATDDGEVTVEGTHVIPDSVVAESELVPGTVLSIPPSPGAPTGAIVKIESVTDDPSNPDAEIVVTSEGTLSDIVKETPGSVTIEGTFAEAALIPAEGVTPLPVEERAFNKTFDGPSLPFTADLKPYAPGMDKAKLSGNLKSRAFLTLDAGAFKGVREFSMTAEVSMDARLDLEKHVAYDKDFDFPLIVPRAYPVTFTVGAIPIHGTVTPKANFQASIHATGDFNYHPSFTTGMQTGVRYQNNNFGPVDHRWFTPSGVDDISIRGKATITAGIIAGVDISLYQTVSTSGDATIEAILTVTLNNTDLRCDLVANFRPSLSLHAQVPLTNLKWERRIAGFSAVLWANDRNLCSFSTDPGDGSGDGTGDGPGDGSDPGSDPGDGTGDTPGYDRNNVIPDEALRVFINRELGKEDLTSPVTQDELDGALIRSLHITNEIHMPDGSYRYYETLEGIQYIRSLEELEIGYYGFDFNAHIPDLSVLPHLSKLVIYGASQHDFDEAAGTFPALASVELWSGNWRTLPSAMFEHPAEATYTPSLRSIKIYNLPYLAALPESLGQQTTMNSITISETAISTLPDSIGNITSLQNLSLSENPNLRSLPDDIGNSPSLNSLRVTQSPALTSLPESLFDVVPLRSVEIRNTGLSTLPDNLGNAEFLNSLNVSDNRLKTLPDSIGNLHTLSTLDVSGNTLSALPESVTTLYSLSTLYAGGNRLESLPDNWENMGTLSSLSLSDNLLRDNIPESFGEMPSLEYLYLSGNGITQMPEFLKHRLHPTGYRANVHLERNPITTVPEFVLTSHADIYLYGTGIRPDDPVVLKAGEDGNDVGFSFSR